MTAKALNDVRFHDQTVNSMKFDFHKKEIQIIFGLWDDATDLEVEKTLVLINVRNFKLSEFMGITLDDFEVYSHSVSEENGVNKIHFDFLADRSSQNIEMLAEFESFSFT